MPSVIHSQKQLRSLSIFWSLFNGIGAVLGSAMMFVDPSGVRWGMEEMLLDIQKLPASHLLFQDFVIPGLALLLFIGAANFISFFLIFRRSPYAALSVVVCGVILVLWIVVQFVIFPFNGLSVAFLFIGVFQVLTGVLWSRGQEG